MVLDTYTQTHTWNEHGERSDYTMPAAAGMTFQAGWAQSVHHDYDAMGNLIAITCGTRQLMSAQYRNAGRADSRTVTTAGNATILRSYGYDPASSLLKRMLVQSNGIAIAGSEVDYDGLQIRSTQLLGVSSDQRYSQFRYDDRSRLRASVAGAAADANPFAAVPGRSLQALTPADFRSADERQSHFDTATAAALQAKRVDTTTIDPPSKTFSELPGGGHKIEQVTRGSRTFVFGWNNGSERIDDGRFTYDFDAKGRLIRATEKSAGAPRRRMVYTYSPTGRMIGRRAEYSLVANPAPADWKLEDRPQVINIDGLPAETTYVWDPVSDNVLEVFKAGAAPASAGTALIKQIIHGGASYDDPIETATLTTVCSDPVPASSYTG